MPDRPGGRRLSDRLLPDALRLALGTLTVLPVPPPRRVDRRTGGGAMLLAPGVGLGLGGLVALVVWALRQTDASALLAAALVLALLAAATRGLHLDGLADTADGLGSGRPTAGALEIMKRSDIGPFGVVTLVLVLLLDATAAAQVPAAGICAAVLAGRAALPLACRQGIPAARRGGLGSTVAGTVRTPLALLSAALTTGLGALLLLDWRGAVAVAVALVASELGLRHCVRRLGGVTGDVLGALVEISTLVCLVTLALLR